jgi:hypothetical protein
MPVQAAARIAIFALLGAGAGTLHFVLLRRNVDLIVTGGSVLKAAATTMIRFVLTMAVFVAAAIFHGAAVAWMLAGFVAARMTAVRIVKAGL